MDQDLKEEGKAIIKEWAKKVLLVQDASNLTAVIRMWGTMQSDIRNHGAADGSWIDGPAVDKHPLNVMMLSKVTSMMRAHCDGIGGVTALELNENDTPITKDLFHTAYDATKKLAGCLTCGQEITNIKAPPDHDYCPDCGQEV